MVGVVGPTDRRRPSRLPPWLGDPGLHRSHQSALLRKDPAWYAARFPGVPADVPFLWPVAVEAAGTLEPLPG